MDAVAIEGLTKKYGDFVALNNLNLTIKQGEVLGYLGPNGSGKTTTIRLMLGMIKPTSGQVTILGLDAQKQKEQVHRSLAYVPGEANLWPFLTGIETLHLLARVHGKTDAYYRDELIKRFELEPNKKVRTYSKGNKQKITLIAALASRAELLVLDEPTSGLDPLMEQVFREAVIEAKKNGQTVFLSSHILEEVESLCERVAVLKSGTLVELGTLSEMRHLSAVTIDATFTDKPPKIDHIKGVSNVRVHGHHLTCQVTGPIDGLLQVLTPAKPVSLLSREPSLEELFLSLYGENGNHAEARK
jgi:ABC-2 type transport system ATP-binding protein